MNIKQIASSQEFWDKFALNYWECECLSIKNSFINPPITEDELFSIIVNECNNMYSDSRFYIEGTLQKIEKTNFLWPKKKDLCFTNYNKRISSSLNGREYTLVIDRLQVNPYLWDWTYDFLQKLYKSLGYLNYGHFFSIFYGNYKATPFGVHHDGDSGFYFPIRGTKMMRTWKPEFVVQHPKLNRAREYKDFIEDSTLLEAEPGGMLYWPSDRWHVGDSRGGDVSIVLAINISDDLVIPLSTFICEEIHILYGNSFKRYFLELLAKALPNWYTLYQEVKIWHHSSIKEFLIKLATRSYLKVLSILVSIKAHKKITTKSFFNPEDLQGSVEKVPESIRLAAITFEGIIDSLIIKRASIKLWLNMLTGYGFWPLSISQSESFNCSSMLTVDTYFQIFPKLIILWKRVDENEIFVSVNGFCISVSSHPFFPFLINKINSGEINNITNLIIVYNTKNSQTNVDVSIANILTFLENLLRYRGIKVIE
ncbi:hypothetical protein BZZ01_09600 [Nostocales cyanobacterium HT-58-2]|nr:hypothetical protein BZZ01_09600 [Nostocales cyanobacterium HT-58-2]